MNKVLTGLCVLFLLMTANAQAHCGHCGVGDSSKDDMGAMVSEKVQGMTKELALNDEQKGKVEGIIKEKMAKKQQLMEENRKAMDAVHEDFTTKLNGVLTEEQKTKWEARKKDGPGEMKCPKCKDGKMCKKCKIKKHKEEMAGHCPKCKDGKMCKKCMLKEDKEDKEHEHEHSK